MAQTVLLVDAYALIYRAYFAIRSLTGPRGEPVNAIFGFTKTLRKLLTDYRPSHAAAVFDLGPPRERLSVLPTYKAHRPPTPPELDAQLPAIREMLQAMRLPIVEIEGEEADDIIATLATRATLAGATALIASSDKDFMQLVGPQVRLIRPDSKEAVPGDAAYVEARYGVNPEQIVDLLCLVGDAVDNIPGVPGVGEKTAADLLRTYRSLDNLLAHAGELPKPKLREAIMSRADLLRLNRELIRLRTNLPLPVELEDLRIKPPDQPKLTALLGQLGFKSLLAEVEREATASRDLFAQG